MGTTRLMWRPTASSAVYAEEPLGGGVPGLNDPVRRLAEDGVLRRLHDGGQQASVRLPLRFRTAPLGDVAEDQDAAGHVAGGISYGRRAVLDGLLQALSREKEGVASRAHHGIFADGSGGRALDGQAGLLVDDAEDIPERKAGGLGPGPAGQGLGSRVQPLDAAFVVRGDDRVSYARDGGPDVRESLLDLRPGRAHGPSKVDDDSTRGEVHGEGDEVDVAEVERAPWLDEQILRRHVAQRRRPHGGRDPTPPDGCRHGAVERREGSVVTEPAIEQPTHTNRNEDGEGRHQVSREATPAGHPIPSSRG